MAAAGGCKSTHRSSASFSSEPLEMLASPPGSRQDGSVQLGALHLVPLLWLGPGVPQSGSLALRVALGTASTDGKVGRAGGHTLGCLQSSAGPGGGCSSAPCHPNRFSHPAPSRLGGDEARALFPRQVAHNFTSSLSSNWRETPDQRPAPPLRGICSQ